MAVTAIGEGITVETAEPLCEGCLVEPQAVAWGLCADCADFDYASDRFKERFGYRPRMDRESVIAWYRDGMVGFP